MTDEKNVEENVPIYKQKKGILGIVGICCIGILLLVVVGGLLSPDNNNSSSSNTNDDPFNGKGAKLENVTVSSSYGFFKVNGKIMFKRDHSYASIGADVNLKDGSKISESIVENWNDVQKDQLYSFDGSLFSTSGGSHSMSDIESIDFKFDNDIIYTWKNS